MEEIHGHQHEFLFHLDADVIAHDEMAAVNHLGAGGLGLEYVQQVFTTLAAERYLAAIEITGYNPERDSDGKAAQTLVRLITNALKSRLITNSEKDPTTSTETTEVNVVPGSLETSQTQPDSDKEMDSPAE